MVTLCLPGRIDGRIQAPVSKSSQQRAIACALLAKGRSRLFSATDSLCADSAAALGLAESLGAETAILGDRIEIESPGAAAVMEPRSEGLKSLSCGESGLCMRMFAPVLALSSHPFVLKAEGSLRKRPMDMVAASLASMGTSCTCESGLPPLRIQGPLGGGGYVLDASGSSQFLTGLLMSLPLARKDSFLRVENPVSLGYIDLTIETCGAFGAVIQRSEDYREYSIKGGQAYEARDFRVEGDWSGAAFLICAAAAAGGSLSISGLRQKSSQPDRAVLEAAAAAGVSFSWEARGETLAVHGSRIHAFDFDATNCPDLFPPLSILAAAGSGISRIKGTHRLKAKESDRAATIATLLGNLGVRARLEDDTLIIEGGRIHGGGVEAAGDHRIAMAAAIAALIASGPVEIRGSECVSKSWPDFFQAMDGIRRHPA